MREGDLNNLKLAVVTPVYEDRESFRMLCSDLAKLNLDITVFAVDDGSIEAPLMRDDINIIENIKVIIIKLKKNVGHQRAIAIGLNYIYDKYPEDFHFIITMDSDGEDIPYNIINLLKALMDRNKDLAVASRRKRNESLKFRIFYKIYKLIFLILTGHKINFGNFMVFRKGVLKRIVSINEIWTHLAASMLMSKLRIAYVFLDRGNRYKGESKMNFVGLVLHGFRALMVFAENVLVRIGILSIFIASLSIIGILIAIILKFIGKATPGWFSVATGILFIVFLLTAILSLVSLIFTGILKSNIVPNIDYRLLIDEIYE